MALIQTLAYGAGAIGLAIAATYLIPAQVHVERSALVEADPATVIALAASNRGYQKFNPYLAADPALKITHFGPDHGVGSSFHFDGRDGKGSQTVAEVGPAHVRYEIDLGPMGKPSQTLRVTPTDNGTQVTWSMDADMGLNPIARVMGLFMERMMGKTFEAGLSRIQAATA
ncbi:polyketide cyclase/dehydrase/lipid transport protein [Litoreibacter ponti]|uniref:Polyketide cyclase/dehydrase/lipid transport protein n=1 Tax=Litoreibacter ponti TaxID=1510457 RepID=A0A2T6BE58_9RHOB|nr:SRPBCC family protein [Litoreibacter ponti]PTX54347.1 polyketide cyclase/dehydrase/lipid transport protein [Litoreibacter ponti]